MSDATISMLVLGAIVALFISGRVPIVVVAIGAGLLLAGFGVISAEQAVRGFGDPTVVFIASLFIVSDGLDRTGVMSWIGQRLLRMAGGNQGRVLLVVMAAVAVLTAFLSVNGAVAALLPMVVLVGWRTGHPGMLLMPLAFAAHAGSLLTLTGSPVNVFVADALAEAGGERIGYLEFGLVGVPLVFGSLAMMLVLAPRVLPRRELGRSLPNLSGHGEVLRREYEVPADRLAAGAEGMNREIGLVEVMVPPRSAHLGEEVFAGMSTSNHDVIAVAIRHQGATHETATTLRSGDTILLQGPWEALEHYLETTDLLPVNEPTDIRRQAVPMAVGARRALAAAGIMVALLVSGVVPAFSAGLIAAGLLVVSGVMSIEQSYQAIRWTTVLLVGGMFAVSTAITESGAAAQMADALLYLVGDAGQYALLAALFVLTATLGQLISNMATAMVVLPVALVAAADMGVAAEPVAISIAVAAAAALLTPVATPVNLMVQEPGGYRFGDYWRLGLPLLSLYFLVAVFLVPAIW